MKKGILVSLETELIFLIKFRSADVIQSPASMLSDQVLNNPGNGFVVVNSGMLQSRNLFQKGNSWDAAFPGTFDHLCNQVWLGHGGQIQKDAVKF